MHLSDRLGHLTYSTLVHAGDTWPEMRQSLQSFLPAVKQQVSPWAPMGVSLRLSSASVSALAADPALRAELSGFLADQDLYVYTVNAFPHGPFKGRRVMEQVYEPDWGTDERVQYTTAVADVLAEVAAPGVEPSIQTAPLAFRPNVTGPEAVERLTRNLLRVVAHLVELERRTGRRVKLALEPEPACFLETTEETVAYFEEHVYSTRGAQVLSGLCGVPLSEAHGLVRRHLGVVFDIGHQAVGFEDVPESLGSLVAAGIPIYKLQPAAALWVPEVTDEAVHELERFTDTIYLSQTTERREGAQRQFLNLSEAIQAWKEEPSAGREWRTHFHVPVFLDEIGPFRTTRFGIEQALAVHVRTPLSDHLEIETYTWDVLPAHLKTGDITEYVSRELTWLKAQLAQQPDGAAPSARDEGLQVAR